MQRRPILLHEVLHIHLVGLGAREGDAQAVQAAVRRKALRPGAQAGGRQAAQGWAGSWAWQCVLGSLLAGGAGGYTVQERNPQRANATASGMLAGSWWDAPQYLQVGAVQVVMVLPPAPKVEPGGTGGGTGAARQLRAAVLQEATEGGHARARTNHDERSGCVLGGAKRAAPAQEDWQARRAGARAGGAICGQGVQPGGGHAAAGAVLGR